MNLDYLRTRLETNGSIIVSLFEGTTKEEAVWTGRSPDSEGRESNTANEGPDMVFRWSREDRWSLLQIAQHLVVEERDDFRARLSALLSNPNDSFESFEWPFGSEDDDIRKLDLDAVVMAFDTERAHSLRWLRTLDHIDLNIVHQNPHQGTEALRVGDLAAAWITHDYYHIRQITNLRWIYLEHSSAPYSSRYAGPFYETDA